MPKSTPEEIRARFDRDVDRFSSLETGQAAAMDSRLMLDLIADTCAALHTGPCNVLDIGCGAGNYTLRLEQSVPVRAATVIDLSRPMLDRAAQRLTAAGITEVTALQGDVREISLGQDVFDIAVAAAVLHHLRSEDEWRALFRAVFVSLRPGGSFWIADMVEHDTPAVHGVLWSRYGDYLTNLKDAAYRDHVFAYIEKEDTPRSVTFQLRMLREAGFPVTEVLHKNGPFACFGGVKI